jgi:hypothetical protein
MPQDGDDSDDEVDSGWDEPLAPGGSPEPEVDEVDAGWEGLEDSGAPARRRRPSRPRRKGTPPAPEKVPVVRPAPAATPSSKHLRRKLARQGRARAAAAKAQRKAEHRTRSAVSQVVREPEARPRPATVRARPKTEPGPKRPAEPAREPDTGRPKRPRRSEAKSARRANEKSSKPIVLVLVVVALTATILGFALSR